MKIKLRAYLIGLLLLVWLVQFVVCGVVLAIFGWISFLGVVFIIIGYLSENESMTLEQFIYSDDLKTPKV